MIDERFFAQQPSEFVVFGVSVVTDGVSLNTADEQHKSGCDVPFVLSFSGEQQLSSAQAELGVSIDGREVLEALNTGKAAVCTESCSRATRSVGVALA